MSFGRQFKAIFKRRALIAKRSKFSVITFPLISLLGAAFSVLLLPMLTFQTSKGREWDYSFATHHPFNLSVAVVGKRNEQLDKILTEMAQTELSVTPQFYQFNTKEDLDEFVVNEQEKSIIRSSLNIVYGYQIEGEIGDNVSITYFYNASEWKANGWGKEVIGLLTTLELLRKSDPSVVTYAPHFVEVSLILQRDSYMDMIPGYGFPFVVAVLGCMFLIQVNSDLKSEIRPYMIAFGMSKTAYWSANLAFDSIFYYGLCLVYWCMRIAIVRSTTIQKVEDALALWLSGPAIVLMTYLFCYISRIKFVAILWYFIVMIMTLVSTSLLLSINDCFFKNNSVMAWLAWLNPLSGFLLTLTTVADLDRPEIPGLLIKSIVMPVVDFFFYIFLLAFIDFVIPMIRKTGKKLQFETFAEQSLQVKRKQPVTEEALEMERSVAESSPGQYAVKINNVSKIFKDSKGNPIFAVNHLSLGIEPGTMFGFLGANGAGKTTLLNMIIGKEDISNGSIEIDGHDVTKGMDPSILTVCPQFDRHLTPELTGREQLVFYANLCGVENPNEKVDEMIRRIDYESHCDKLVREMSGGNQRKCSVLIPFLSNSSIILLDEPTASLDPLARHKVHELIQEHKGRTYMLCTHLLDEAEALCDKVSIMIHGCVYAIGKPEELADKFGSDFKIDVLLNDDSAELKARVHEFIMRRIPTAKNPIDRMNSRMYTVPSSDITILDLFSILDECMSRDMGLKSYTCSSSTLERVFLEIILLSSQANNDEPVGNEDGVPVV